MSNAESHVRPDPKLAREARDWVVRLASGEVQAADLQVFHRWKGQSDTHARAFEQERAFWQQLGALAPGGERAQDRVLPLQPARAAPLIGRRGFIAGGIAAGAAVWALDVPHKWQDWTSDLHTGFGEMAGMTLPDGSVATLNTDSAIALDFQAGRRRVQLLRGEAEFRVPDDNGPHLSVAALEGITEARGSVFSVGIEAGQARVTVSQGAVRVIAAGDRLELGPSDQAVYQNGTRLADLGQVDPEVAFAWREGRIIFDGKRFDLAMQELARYVPEKVVMGPGINAAMPVSAIFSTSAAHDAITALALTQGLSVRRVPQVMILVS